MAHSSAGDVIRAFLIKYNLTQTELAEYLEVDCSTITRWLGGQRKPGRVILVALTLYDELIKASDVDSKTIFKNILSLVPYP